MSQLLRVVELKNNQGSFYIVQAVFPGYKAWDTVGIFADVNAAMELMRGLASSPLEINILETKGDD